MRCHVGAHTHSAPLPALRSAVALQMRQRTIGLKPYKRREKGRCVQCKCTSAAGLLFTVTTVATIPIYFTMIAFPKWKQTNTMMKSRLSMLGACCLHAAAFVMWWTTGALKGAGTALRHRRVEWFAGLMHRKELTCLAWTHLLLLDLFQARYVFMDGQRHSIPTRHSLALCFLFGPIGLMSHMVTRYIVSRRSAPWQSLPS